MKERSQAAHRREVDPAPVGTFASPSGRFVYAFLFLGLGWLGWQVIADTMADTRAAGDPEGALAWRADLPPALVGLAEQRLVVAKTEQDLTGVSELADRALAASPIAPGALRLLGLVADLKGKTDEARTLMDLAGRQSLRDTVAQVWLFDQDLHAGRSIDALASADAMLRTRPDLGEQLLPALASVAADPAAGQSLIHLLATNPPWRTRLLMELPKVTDPAIDYAILSGLQTGPNPPTAGELQPYVDHLVDLGQFELAYLAWLHFLPPGHADTVSYAYNGDFEVQPSGLAFDWVISDVAGAHTEWADAGDKHRGHALRITFANTRVAYHHIRKLMILPPGHYELSGMAKADNLNNERGMTWRVYCAEGDKTMIAETARISGTQPWQQFATAFDVPASGCRGQWLVLELAARVAMEEEVGGEVWFDDLAVEQAGNAVAGTTPSD